MTNMRSMVARKGRENQVYTDSGARVVAGTVVLNATKDKVLLISSESHPKKWIIPKGGAEIDETIEQSAVRETWEEAGAIGTITHKIGEFTDLNERNGHTTLFHFYEMQITELAEDWPEKHKRRREWTSFAEAHAALMENRRVQLAEALEKSTIRR